MRNVELKYKIFVFRAIDEPELCERYIEGHVKVLTDYGITNVTTNNREWINNPYIYCTVAIDMNTNDMVGGTRVQIADGKQPLPVENAIGKMDSKIYEKVANYRLNGGIGESCGLWISKSVKNVGLSRYLMWGSISSSIQLNFNIMLGICAGYTLKMFTNIGFVIDYMLGNNGDFPYPNTKYIAHVIGILNAITLETSAKYDKEKMLSLRKNPIQTRIEKNNGLESEIHYELVFSKVTPIRINESSMPNDL